MTTGQAPRRRETDAQAERRVAELERRRAEQQVRPLSTIEQLLDARRVVRIDPMAGPV